MGVGRGCCPYQRFFLLILHPEIVVIDETVTLKLNTINEKIHFSDSSGSPDVRVHTQGFLHSHHVSLAFSF